MIKLIKSLFNDSSSSCSACISRYRLCGLKCLIRALFATKLIRCQRCGHEYPESYNSCPIADCGTIKLMKFSGNSHDRRKKRRELKEIAALCVFSQLTLYIIDIFVQKHPLVTAGLKTY